MTHPRSGRLAAGFLLGFWALTGVAAPALAHAGAGEANRSDTRRTQRAIAEQNRSEAKKLRRQQAKSQDRQRAKKGQTQNSRSSAGEGTGAGEAR
jgi:hypothetical protein